VGGDSARQSESRDYALESSHRRSSSASRRARRDARRARDVRGRIETRTMSCDVAKSRRGVRDRGRVVVDSSRARETV